MTTMELNAELFHQLSYLADDETYMQKVMAFIKNLVIQKTQQENMEYITKDELLNGIKSGLQDVKQMNLSEAKTLQDVINEL
ncbi:MAG: hypothetical protein J6P44_03975 [Bacteroidales bacterium]|nr:hypothetical protein [Bacteroidales bacterium]